MIGKPTARRSSSRASDMQSLSSFNSVRTVDRARLRDKARQMQMKESLRLAMCARLQQQLRKSPKVAEEMASEVLRVLKQRGLSAVGLSDEALADLVQELSARRQKQLSLAAATSRQPTNQQHERLMEAPQRASGRRSSTSKERTVTNSTARRAKAGGSRSGVQDNDEAVEGNVYLTESQLQQKSVGFHLPPRASPKKDRDNGIWEEIVKFSSVEEQQEAAQVRERKLRVRREFTSHLEAQVKQKHSASQKERENSAQFHREAVQRLHAAEDEERRKEQERLERAQQLIAIQTEQRQAKRQQQERERAAKKAQEQQAAATLAKQKQDDLAREQARREAEKRRVAQVQLENEVQLERKRQQQERERQLEVKLAEDYVAMERRKDEARKAQLAAMADNIQKKMKIFDDTAKASMDAKEREEDERVRRYQLEYARQQAEDERRRQEEAEARSRSQQDYLRVQMLEKREREAARKRDLDKQAELWRQERLEAERRERLANQQRAVRNRSQQDMLRQQMREREQRSLQADQTMLEVQLNARLLRKIHQQAGSQSPAEDVVSETQNRSRELQEQEENFLKQQRQPQREATF